MKIMTNKRLVKILKDTVLEALKEPSVQRNIAMDYLVSLKPSELRLFNEAVELRRDSEAKLSKLAEKAPDFTGEFEPLEKED